MTTWMRALAAVLLAVLGAGGAIAADAPSDGDRPKAENTICPITGKPVDPTLAPVPLTVSGKTHWLGFANAAAADAARRDPQAALNKLAALEGKKAAAGKDGDAPKH